MSPRFWRRAPFWISAAVFVAAAALRLSLVSTARFTGDEANDYAVGMDIAHGVSFPLLGTIITNGPSRHPGPLFYWMAAFPQLFTRAPEAGNVFFELLGASTAWMFWLGLRRPFGEAAAAFAGLLMALSPWSALFGDRVWNPHGFLFLETLAVLAVMRLRDRPGSAWAAVVPVACLALPQFHMSAVVVWLALLPLALGNVRSWNRRFLGLGVVLALMLYIPYGIHEATTGLGNTRAFLGELAAGRNKHAAAPSLGFLLAPIYAVRFLTLDVTYHELSGYWGGLNESAAWRALWLGSEARPFHPLRLAAFVGSALLMLSALLVAVVVAVRRGRREGWRRALGPFALSALLAVALDTALLGVTHKPVFAHYVLPVLPFVFVAYAALARRAWRSPPLRAALLGLGVVFCLGGVEATLSVSRHVDGRNGLGVHRAVFRRFADDCAAEHRSPAATPLRLETAFLSTSYSYGVFVRYAARLPVRLSSAGGGLFYMLRKPTDPLPGDGRFPVSHLGPADLYRLR